MRTLTISVLVSCLTWIAAPGCGSDTDGSGSQGGTAGSGGAGGAGGGGGASDACAGKACGDACTTCPEGAPCIPQACNAEGICVDALSATCSPCPATPPADGEACATAGLVCETEEGIVVVCRSRTTCTPNGWQTIAPGCSSDPAPEPACPASQPSGMCDVNMDPGLCEIGDTFCGCSDCLGGPCGGQAEWVCAALPNAPCPPIAPKLGSVCANDGLSCVYGACPLGGTTGGRTCEGGIWTEDIVQCPQ